MGYQSITPNTDGILNNKAVVSNNPNNFGIKTVFTPVASGSISLYSTREMYDRGSFNVGSGRFIDHNGVMLYDSTVTGSGVLETVLLANRGNSTFYFGINTSTPNVADGTPLASGESFSIEDGAIRKLWAICQAGQSTIVSAEGPYRYNQNTI